ncbi:MAG TPA: hypothetical protein VFB19_11840 [Mycobacterium sp.]|nr:hypothetical protein [Mycobacterium sp.]
MTIIELNIAGLHLTRSTPSRKAVKRSFQRNCRTWRQTVRTGQWRTSHVRARQAERSAA